MIIRNYMISNSKFVALLFRHSGCPGCLASIAQAAIFRVEDNWQCLSFTLTRGVSNLDRANIPPALLTRTIRIWCLSLGGILRMPRRPNAVNLFV